MGWVRSVVCPVGEDTWEEIRIGVVLRVIGRSPSVGAPILSLSWLHRNELLTFVVRVGSERGREVTSLCFTSGQIRGRKHWSRGGEGKEDGGTKYYSSNIIVPYAHTLAPFNL